MKFKNYQINYKWFYMASIFLTGLSLPMRAFAESDIAKTLIGYLGELIWAMVISPIAFILGLEIELLRFVAKYNNFVYEVGVNTGWIAMRDLSNMFFILILLVIAFATILGISNYGYQQLLKRTIIIAILINFSKTIVGFLIDIVQVVMLTFIAAVDNALSGDLAVALGLQKMMDVNVGSVGAGAAGMSSIATYIIPLILAVVFLLILVVLIGVMLMMLVMRIVALWVLIVLAPLAFLSNIFPYTKSFFGKWSKELGSNLVAGPMLAFFLWLTLTIVGDGNIHEDFIPTDTGSTGGGSDFLGATSMINYIIAIALLITGIKEAASSGAAGANFASKGMNKIQSAASGVSRQLRRPGAAAAGAAGAYAKGVGLRVRAGAAKKAFTDSKGRLKTLPWNRGKLDKTDKSTKFSRINEMRDTQDGGLRAFGRKMTGKALAGARDSKLIGKVRDAKWEQMPIASQVYKKGLEWRGEEYKYSKEQSDEAVAKARPDQKADVLAHRAGQHWVPAAGGDKFAKNEDAKARHVAGKIRSSEDGQAARKIADAADDKKFQRDLGASHPNTLKSVEEAKRLVQKEGIDKALSGLSGRQADGDKDDNNLHNLFEAALDAQQGPALSRKINELPQEEQEKVSASFQAYHAKIEEDDSPVSARNSDDSIKMRNGTAVFDDRNRKNQAGDVLMHIAPGAGKVAKDDRAAALSGEAADETKGLEAKIAVLKGKKTIAGKAGKEEEVGKANEEIEKIKKRIEELKPLVKEGGSKRINYKEEDIEEAAREQLERDGKTEPTRAAPGIVKQPTDEEVNERVTQPTSQEITQKVKANNDTWNTPQEESLVRKKAEKDILTDRRTTAEQDILSQRHAEAAIQNREAVNEYNTDSDNYEADLRGLIDKMTKAVSNINVDTRDQKNDIHVQLSEARSMGDTGKLEKLQAQLVNLTRLQNIKLAGALGKSEKGDASSAVVKGMAKNMDYSNLSEMDIHIPEIKHLFEQFAKVASPGQQRQLYETANPEQLQIFARAVVDNGQRLTKMLREALPHHVSDDLTKKEKAVR